MKSHYLLSAALAGLLGCAQTNRYFSPYNQSAQIKGILKDEVHVRGMFMDTYSFSLNTKNGIKVFSCSGYEQPRELNVILSPGDEVTVTLPRSEWHKENNFDVCLDDILLLNGEVPPRLDY